jgi:hypothetical protein
VKKALLIFFVLETLLILNSIALRAQDLTLDSLMQKVENLGNYLMYRDQDSTYIRNYSNEFTLRVIAVNKFNYFKIRDRENNSTLRYRPDRRLNLGLGMAYKWFSLDVAFNVGIHEDTEFKNKKHFDFHGTIFSSKQYISTSLQYYYGYRLTDHSGISFDSGDDTEVRDDIRSIRFALQYLYAFNYDKFSLKAPFILNERQLKSAGSWLFGVGFNLFVLDADSSMVPQTALNDFEPELHLQDLNTMSLSVNGGYLYSLIFKKHFFLTLGFVPGIALNVGDSQTQYRDLIDMHVSFVFTTMNALGYNGRKIYCGVQFSGDMNNIKVDKKLKTETGSGKARLFIGYRFQKKKSG